jgi:hypothetical protein
LSQSHQLYIGSSLVGLYIYPFVDPLIELFNERNTEANARIAKDIIRPHEYQLNMRQQKLVNDEVALKLKER